MAIYKIYNTTARKLYDTHVEQFRTLHPPNDFLEQLSFEEIPDRARDAVKIVGFYMNNCSETTIGGSSLDVAAHHVHDKGFVILMAKIDGKPIGYIFFRPDKKQLVWPCVEARFKKRYVALYLVLAVVDYAKEKGFDEIMVEEYTPDERDYEPKQAMLKMLGKYFYAKREHLVAFTYVYKIKLS